MVIRIRGAREHNLKSVDIEIGPGLTVVTGVSGSGKSSLVFDTLYHEARRRFLEVYANGTSSPRLSPAAVDEITGLGPAIAVGQNLLNRNPASTLATASGLHPFFRLLFARFGARVCPSCGSALAVHNRDEVVRQIVKAGREGSLVEVPLLRGAAGSHTQLLRTAGQVLPAGAVLYVDGIEAGTRLDPLAPHDISLRMTGYEGWDDQQARQMVDHLDAMGVFTIEIVSGERRSIFPWRPVCGTCGRWFTEVSPQDFHRVCRACQGAGCSECKQSGLPPDAAAVSWMGLSFPQLISLGVNDCADLFRTGESVSERIRTEITRRLAALIKVGLGYLTLNRVSPSLSRGEAQRVRLAVALTNRLSDLLHVLDEPTVGLHPADVERLVPAFRDLNGPTIFVEHDRNAVADADEVIDIGPGAGSSGGQVVFQGLPAELWRSDTLSGEWFSLRRSQPAGLRRAHPRGFLTIRGAAMNNLQNLDVRIPLGCLTVVTGVSGSGKSSLVEDVLAASLVSKRPVGCQDLTPWLDCELVDQSPIGRNPRSNPATYTKLADHLREIFAAASGLSAAHFSFNRPEGACPACDGLGATEVAMRYLPSSWVRCETCEGKRFNDLVLSHPILLSGRKLNVAEFFWLPAGEMLTLIQAGQEVQGKARADALRILSALCKIGLDYLPLGQPSTTLSGGEAQRVKLARFLGMRSLAGKLLILDEPSTGLHAHDLSGLLDVFRGLSEAGATLVVVEHNLDVIRAADWIIDLGPGSGPAGGKVVFQGPAEDLAAVEDSLTAQALRRENDLRPRSVRAAGLEEAAEAVVAIRGARANNLRGLDVNIPKGKLTVVTGVSGSGKSSLVSEVLEGEARRRFYEMLSMYERQGVHEGREAEVDAVTGLGVTLRAAPEKLAYARRATVGTLTETSYHLAVLYAFQGEKECLACGAAAMNRRQDGYHCPACGATALLSAPSNFLGNSYGSACPTCHGVGSFQKPSPAKLIVAPDKPLCAGAMYSPGFFPNGYLGKPGNGGYFLVQALARRYGFDPDHTAWNEMTEEAQQVFLFGGEEELDVYGVSKSGRVVEHRARFPGFYRFVGDWDVGNTYTDNVICPDCGGSRLRREFLTVKLVGLNIAEMSEIPLGEVQKRLDVLKIDATFSPLRHSIHALRERVGFLCQVGLRYLTLGRTAGTLSAGEVQRLRLASLLGSQLTSLTILLDEPTRGMHPVEVGALKRVLVDLSRAGNTVIVVEHDEEIMRCADHLIDMGPGAGADGGLVVAQGKPEQVEQGKSLTALWLRGERRVEIPSRRRIPGSWLVLHGARENNLHGDTVRFPLGVLCGVCGVSGSGKSTLVIDTLGRILAPTKYSTSVAYEPLDPGAYTSLEGAPARTYIVDQSRAGMSSPAAWLGVNDLIRDLFLDSDEARELGVSSDRPPVCPTCGGRGSKRVDMAFLPDLDERCEDCAGTGWTKEAETIRYHGVALRDVMRLQLAPALDLFRSEAAIARPLQAAVDVGLGYLALKQPGNSLSGGEAQRLKIAHEIAKRKTAGTLYILDEPTVGQHLEDVLRLCGVLHKLVDSGASVLVVEHHPLLLAACDWLIELGPGGGPDGGAVILSGTPESAALGTTPIAPYLARILKERI